MLPNAGDRYLKFHLLRKVLHGETQNCSLNGRSNSSLFAMVVAEEKEQEKKTS
jgi:hypothetical protein